MQYMYFTPRDLINFHSTNNKGQKPQQLNFGPGIPGTGPLMLNNNNIGGQGGGPSQANTT